MGSRRFACFFLFAVALTLAIRGSMVAPPGLTYITINHPGQTLGPGIGDVDNLNRVVGVYKDQNGRDRGFVFVSPFFAAIDFPGSAIIATWPHAIADNGRVAGHYIDATTGLGHGFVFDKYVYNSIDAPNAAHTTLEGINEAGSVVGFYSLNVLGGSLRGFAVIGGQFQLIDAPGATDTYVYGIDNSNRVAGAYKDASGKLHGFTMEGGLYTTVDFPGALETSLTGISPNGRRLVGTYLDNARVSHGFSLVKRTFSTVDFPGALRTTAEGINDAGAVSGTYTDASGPSFGFLATP